MALTLAEGAKLSNDVLLEGVIETVINDSPAALDASLERARAAYARLAEQVQVAATHDIPAGNPPRGSARTCCCAG